MGDSRDDVPHDESALSKLEATVPGFEGYQEQTSRRGADKVLREHFTNLLDEVRQRLFRFQGELRSRGEFKPVTDLDRLSRRLVRARDRVEHAPYSYFGFLDAAAADARALAGLYDYDLAIVTRLAAIDAAAAAVTKAAPGQYEDAIVDLSEGIDELSRLIDARSEVAAALTP